MTSYYDRYQRGEYASVWSELIALGDAVRQEPVHADAIAVARETMRRARQNVETLIARLDGIGYEFMTPQRGHQILAMSLGRVRQQAAELLAAVRKDALPGFERFKAEQPELARQTIPAMELIARSPDMERLIAFAQAGAAASHPASGGPTNSIDNPSIYRRAHNRDAELNGVEQTLGGPLPISLRAWAEVVASVSFAGSHPVLNPPLEAAAFSVGPPGEDAAPVVLTNPLVLHDVISAVRNAGDPDLWDEDGGFLIAPRFSDDPVAFRGIRVPNLGAEAGFGNSGNSSFVEYLRRAFAWGGFPGWERYPNPPLDLIHELTGGLEPL